MDECAISYLYLAVRLRASNRSDSILDLMLCKEVLHLFSYELSSIIYHNDLGQVEPTDKTSPEKFDDLILGCGCPTNKGSASTHLLK